MALLDSVHLRQQRMFEDELWRHFQRVLQSSGRCDVDGICSCLFVKDLGIAAWTNSAARFNPDPPKECSVFWFWKLRSLEILSSWAF